MGDIIFAVVMGLMCYGMFVALAGLIISESSSFREPTLIKDDFLDWQKAYNRRAHADKNSHDYAYLRRDERDEAIYLLKSIMSLLFIIFWPLGIVSIGIYWIVFGVRAVLKFFSNIPKIIDSVKGE